MRNFSFVLFLLLLTNPTLTCGHQSRPSTDEGTLRNLSYCDLLKEQKTYKGALVSLKATWQFGFETTCLYDPSCIEQPKAWLEFADEKALCPETNANRSVPAQSDKEAEVTLKGRLEGPGRYGHLGDYQYKFVVVCLEKIRVTSSDLR